jgi:hypothetical protein
MSRARWAVLLLTLMAVLLAIAGVAGVIVGNLFATWLYSLLPPVRIDVPAVGGAATASGIVLLAMAVLHGLGAIGLARRDPRAITPVAVLAAAMSALAVGWATAAFVSAASGSGAVVLMLPAGTGLGVLALAYAALAWRVIGLRRQPPGRV